MRDIRRRWWAWAAGAVTAGAVLTPVNAASAATWTEGTEAWRPWICVYTDDAVKADHTAIELESGEYRLSEHVLCYRDTSKHEQTRTPTVDDQIVAAFLGQTGLSVASAREEQLGAVLCHDGSVGATSLAKELPSLDSTREACTKPVVPAGAGGGDRGEGGGMVPDLFGSGAGVPSSGAISCGAGGAVNPYADDAGKAPRVTDDDVATSFVTQWIVGVGVMWAASRTGGQATSLGGSAAAGGVGSVAVQSWGNATANQVGNLLDGRYRDAAESLAGQAESFARAAEANAQAAETAAQAAGDQVSKDAAARARAAADEARRAAETARAAAKAAADAKTRREAATAYEAAKKADELAKKKSEEAAKAREDAQKSNPSGQPTSTSTPTSTPTSAPAPTGSTAPTTNGTPAGQDAESTCEKLRQQVWQCEQSGWKTFDCQQLAGMLQGCRVDLTVALVDGDSAVCGTPTISAAELVVGRDRACGLLVAHPVPGVDPCELVVEGSPEITGGCDPSVAYGGCPDEQPVVVEGDDTLCFPAPPGAPPMPCVDPTPGGGPVVGGVLMDSEGSVIVAGGGGVVVLGQGYPPRP